MEPEVQDAEAQTSPAATCVDRTDERTDERAEERSFSDLVQRLIARRTDRLGLAAKAAAPLAAGTTWATLTGAEAQAAPVGPGGTLDQCLVRLVHRISGSFDLSEYAQAVAQGGLTSYVNYQLNPAAIVDTPFDDLLNGTATTPPSVQAVRNFVDPTQLPQQIALGQNTEYRLFQDLVLARNIASRKRLLERMTEFWGDHFSIDMSSKSLGASKITHDRDAIRPNALSTFEAVLEASSFHPAMMVYLDNAFSSFNPLLPNDGYNENFAREFFELHTLGANAGYTEADIKTAAAAWAGHTFNQSGTTNPGPPPFFVPGPNFGIYDWNPLLHDPNNPAATILQNTAQFLSIAANDPLTGGENQAHDLVAGTHSHPATRNFVGGKLLRFLLRYDIDATGLAGLRTTLELNWGNTNGSIAAQIQLILTAANITALNGATPIRKFKRPMQFATGLARAVGATARSITTYPTGYTRLREDLDVLGHAPYVWGPPNGYPDAEGAWIGGLLSRWQVADNLMRNVYAPEIEVPNSTMDALVAGITVPETPDRISLLLTGDNMTAYEKGWLTDYMNFAVGQILAITNPTAQLAEYYELLREMFALGASTPTHQYY